MKKSYVLWFTGLSGSGKTTLAKKLEEILKAKKFNVETVDGDEFREKVHPNLRFSPEEIKLNNKKIIKHCKVLLKDRDFVIVPVIAPFEETRNYAKDTLKKCYIEVFCNSSLATCIKRDSKGLYKKALKGQIKNFVGVDKNVLYEIPKNPSLVINTEKFNVSENIKQLTDFLKINYKIE